MWRLIFSVSLIAAVSISPAWADYSCEPEGTWLQVLGSGGPELGDDRASSGYLLWVDGKARVLIDAGSGVAHHFEKAGARLEDLEAILLTHLHVDHSADLPALLKGGVFTERKRPLVVYGPDAGWKMLSTVDWVNSLLAPEDGSWDYLGGYLSEPFSPFKLIVSSIPTEGIGASLNLGEELSATPAEVIHGPLPALAWRIEVNDRSVFITGDLREGGQGFNEIAEEADLMVIHHAIPEGAGEAAKKLHVEPSMIGLMAASARPGALLLSHRMKRTIGREDETRELVELRYPGQVTFAEDKACYAVGEE